MDNSTISFSLPLQFLSQSTDLTFFFKQFLLQIVGWELDHIIAEHFPNMLFFLLRLHPPHHILLNKSIFRFILLNRHLKLRLHCLQGMLQCFYLIVFLQDGDLVKLLHLLFLCHVLKPLYISIIHGFLSAPPVEQ